MGNCINFSFYWEEKSMQLGLAPSGIAVLGDRFT
jgi:hypothetical protein